jgi:hypothetical protein
VAALPGNFFTFNSRTGDLIRDMDSFDMNWWGVLVVPLGVVLCFGPALVAWLVGEDWTEPAPFPEDKH